MNNNPNQIQVSKDEWKEALIDLLDIKHKDWTCTHDDILGEFKKVKEDILSGEIKDGDTIKEAKEDFKKFYDFFSKNYRRYGKVYILKAVIRFIAEGRVNKKEIETILRGKSKDLQENYYIEIVKNNHYIYIATVAIIRE